MRSMTTSLLFANLGHILIVPLLISFAIPMDRA